MFNPRHRTGLLIAAALAILSVALGIAEAQTTITKGVGSTAVIGWTAPVAFTDGTPIVAGTVVTYTVYQGTTKIATNLTATTFTTQPLTAGQQCFAVSDTVAGQESAQTAQVCITVQQAAPNPPTGLTVR